MTHDANPLSTLRKMFTSWGQKTYYGVDPGCKLILVTIAGVCSLLRVWFDRYAHSS